MAIEIPAFVAIRPGTKDEAFVSIKVATEAQIRGHIDWLTKERDKHGREIEALRAFLKGEIEVR
jgi:hypothetical protein